MYFFKFGPVFHLFKLIGWVMRILVWVEKMKKIIELYEK